MKILIESLGYIGTIFTITAYFLLERRKINSTGIIYPILNLIGAILLGSVGLYNKSSSIVFVNLCWFFISISLLIRNIKRNK